MEQSIFNSLSEITQALKDGGVCGKQTSAYLERCVNDLLYLEADTDSEIESALHEYLPVFDRLISLLPNGDAEVPYYRSIVAIIRGDYQEYLEETEHFYAAMSAKNPDWLDWPAAMQYFVSILRQLPILGKWDEQIEGKLFRAHQKYSSEYFPKSGFDLYCKFLVSNGSDQYLLKLLRDVLEKDSKWSLAWIEIGGICCNQKKWTQALDAYQNAMKDKRTHRAILFFDAAWTSEQLKDMDTAIEYYQHCIDLDPACPYAQNNLGFNLNRQKRYKEAEPYLRYSVEHDEDKRNPCRNLYDCLERQGKTNELLTLVQQYPGYFQTKYYRDRIARISTKDMNVDMDELQKLLQKTTSNEYAGAITVSDERSGIQLYEHQKEAIQDLDKWKRGGSSGAGLLVLPTGGGKTLTATYWLMRSILDQGGKVLWIAHRHELLNQALNAFERVCHQDLSPHKKSYQYRMISGQHDKAVHIKPTDEILIASKSSLAHDLTHIQRWIRENRNQICMVIDEAHHAPASEYRKLIEATKKYGGDFRLLGLTATPFRTAEKEQGLLSKLFPDDILHKTDLRTLIAQGILSEPIFRPIETNIKMADWFHAENADELMERIVSEKGFDFDSPGAPGMEAARLIAAHSERNRLIVDTYVNNQDTYGKTLVFAINVDMAIALNKLFQERGVRSEYVVSSLRDATTGANRTNEQNRAILQQFRDGGLDVLVNVNILTEGTDLPQVQSVFLTRPTKSTILMTQMIGRALRGEKAGGTAKAYIVSFLDDWQEYIAWVNPEKLYIDTNVDFESTTFERRKYAVRLISIAKLEEFARLADDNLDDGVSERFAFLERIPMGLYQFNYLPDEEDEVKNCTVLVYDCMQGNYRELMQWMETADLSDLDAAAVHVDETLFGERDRLLGYQMQDVMDILAYYRQTGVKPQWIPLEERGEYDVALIAKHIVENRYDDLAIRDYLNDEWNRAGGKWTAFFGYENLKAFRKAVQLERDRLIYPEDYTVPTALPLTKKEEVQIQSLPLEEIRRRYPEIGERLRDAVFSKFQDANGYFFSAESGYRSKNKLDFQIDHIKPISQGGQTTLDNLQLLTRQENGAKGDDWQK